MDFIFPTSDLAEIPEDDRFADELSPTTAVNSGPGTYGLKGDGRMPGSPAGHSGRFRLLDSPLRAEIIGAAEQRHSRSVSSTSNQSNRSTSSNNSSVFNQKGPKMRRFGPGLVYYDLLSNIGEFCFALELRPGAEWNPATGGVEDVSFMFYARHVPTGDDVALKYTDLNISSNCELIERLIVGSLVRRLSFNTDFRPAL